MRAKPQVQLHPPCTVKNTCPDAMKGVIMSQMCLIAFLSVCVLLDFLVHLRL